MILPFLLGVTKGILTKFRYFTNFPCRNDDFRPAATPFFTIMDRFVFEIGPLHGKLETYSEQLFVTSASNSSISSRFYSAAASVDAAYEHALIRFDHSDKWSNPHILFSYFKRPPDSVTHDAIRRSDIFSHTGKWVNFESFVAPGWSGFVSFR